MQVACSDDLKQRLFDSGSYTELNTPELLLGEIEGLAVIAIHKSAHLITDKSAKQKY